MHCLLNVFVALGIAAMPPAVEVRTGISIPVRDGVSLPATLYLPAGLGDRRVPVVFAMTPYGRESLAPEATFLAERGLAVAAVGVRGQGAGESFEPWLHDGRDGYDVTEWLAGQAWSTGKVGMFGHSYGGRAVWSTLKEAPPHLAAAVPISPSYPMRSWRNILTPDAMQWISLTSGRPEDRERALDEAFWLAKYRELYLSGRPLADFDRLVGKPSALFQRFIAHPTLDPFWDAVTPTAPDFARIRLPILTVTGAYDATTHAALWYHREHLQTARPGEDLRHFVVIGPWDHAGAFRPRADALGVSFGPAALLPMRELLADWFLSTLAAGPRPSFLAAPVRVYLAGAETWLSAASLAELEGEPETLYLAPGSGAGSLSRPHALTKAPPAAGVAFWVHDPRDTRPGAAELAYPEAPAVRLDAPDDLYGQGLAFLSDPLPRALDLTGTPRLSLWLTLDVPDTDFTARLDLLKANGQTILLGEEWQRARFRTSLARQELAPLGVPREYTLELPFVARRLAAGDRLRLVVRSSDSTFIGRNFQGGGEVARESAAEAKPAIVTLLGGGEHPSRLLLPWRPAS